MMKIGDLVTANYDEQRGIQCIGLVLETRKEEAREYNSTHLRYEAKVMWSSEHSPIGWWLMDHLTVVSESR